MIYLVSDQRTLFNSDKYKVVSPEFALKLLKTEKVLGADTETEGLNFLTKKILTIQLGTEDWQIVWDCTSIDPILLKPIFEDPNTLTIWWNYLFDGLFLYKLGIIPKKVYDGMICEQLLYLGYPSGVLRKRTEELFGEGYTPFSLKTAIKRYCNEELDKTVRGKIIKVGITEETIVYAANDVKYEIPMMKRQLEALKAKDLLNAAKIENEFIKSLVYFKYCGVKLDVPRWKNKMKKDQAELDNYTNQLNNWVINYFNKYKTSRTNITIERRVGRLCEGDYKEIPVHLPKGSKMINGHQESTIENGKEVTYNVGIYDVPFGFTNKGRFYPFVFKDIQGDLFAGFNPNPQCRINWNSNQQVVVLFEILGFNCNTIDKKTKKPKKSVDANTIKPQKNICSIAEPYLKYKEAYKVVSSYGQNWLDQVNVDGRIHPEYHQLGTDTARLSSGKGEDSDDNKSINIQNLPRDTETRACFCAEKGNKWISEDYQSQESRILASVTNDPSMIHLYDEGQSGDMHSLVAYMSYPQIPRDTKIEDIKEKFKNLRQSAKSIEFAINYGGDFNTIHSNNKIPLEEAKVIYESYMKGFPGVKKYQDYCRMSVMRDGYILLNPITKHKAFIYDFDELKEVQEKMKDPEYWKEYRYERDNYVQDGIVAEVKHYYKRKTASEKQAIDYRIQGRGSMCFKLSAIKFFNYILKNNLFGIVKCCIPVHDKQYCCG